VLKKELIFISHAGRDLAWAEWVAQRLLEAGYDVELDAWHWDVGQNFMVRMNDAMQRAHRVVALLSTAYFELSRYTTLEWTALLADRENPDRLVPLRVEEVQLPAIFKPLIVENLYGLDFPQARRALLQAVAGKEAFRRAAGVEGGPRSGVRMPGALPEVWNVPVGTAVFTGRDGDMVDLRSHLLSDHRVALYGIGGVGKTALAIRYAHQFANDYDIVWWIDAEQLAMVGEQVAALGTALGLATNTADVRSAANAAHRHLRSVPRWLVVFDNVEDYRELAAWLPEGPGHVITTSRQAAPAVIAQSMYVDVLTRRESQTLLWAQKPALTEEEVTAIADKVGDLPLALSQAGGVLAETNVPVTDYLRALEKQPSYTLDDGPQSVAKTVQVSMERLAQNDPAAYQLMAICAFLGSDVIPTDLFTNATPGLLPEPLASTLGQPVQFHRSKARIAQYGLGAVSEAGVTIHRLTQAIVREQQGDEFRQMAENLLADAAPAVTDDPAVWPRWATLVPHLLAVQPAKRANPRLREAACRMVRYLVVRGETAAVLPIASGLYEGWMAMSGPDDEHVLAVANRLTNTYLVMGRFDDARQLSEQTRARCQRILGPDHRETIRAANGLAAALRSLGQAAQSRDIYQETTAQCAQVLGEDDPETIGAITGLAHALRVIGEVDRARQMYEEILQRGLRVLGEDHPATLRSANYLSYAWHNLGNGAKAREIGEQAWERCRRILGDNHPETLRAANNVAFALHDLGLVEQARMICEDTLDRARRSLTEDHPETLGVMNNLAYLLRDLGQTAEACSVCAEALQLCRSALGPDHPETLRSANNLAGTLRQLGELDRSIEVYRDTVARRRRTLGDRYPETIRSINGLAGALRAKGELDEAESLYREAYDAAAAVLGKGHPETLRSCIGIAYVMFLRGDAPAGRELMSQTLAFCAATLGDLHPVTVRARDLLATMN
jgi:tetratricopeptide (TPR) repeat protein